MNTIIGNGKRFIGYGIIKKWKNKEKYRQSNERSFEDKEQGAKQEIRSMKRGL